MRLPISKFYLLAAAPYYCILKIENRNLENELSPNLGGFISDLFPRIFTYYSIVEYQKSEFGQRDVAKFGLFIFEFYFASAPPNYHRMGNQNRNLRNGLLADFGFCFLDLFLAVSSGYLSLKKSKIRIRRTNFCHACAFIFRDFIPGGFPQFSPTGRRRYAVKLEFVQISLSIWVGPPYKIRQG